MSGSTGELLVQPIRILGKVEGEKVSMGSSTSELLARPVRILERVEG